MLLHLFSLSFCLRSGCAHSFDSNSFSPFLILKSLLISFWSVWHENLFFLFKISYSFFCYPELWFRVTEFNSWPDIIRGDCMHEPVNGIFITLRRIPSKTGHNYGMWECWRYRSWHIERSISIGFDLQSDVSCLSYGNRVLRKLRWRGTDALDYWT